VNNGGYKRETIDLPEGNGLVGVSPHNSDKAISSTEVDTYDYFFFLYAAGGYIDGYFAHKLILECKGRAFSCMDF
jgi:hypothetical protein